MPLVLAIDQGTTATKVLAVHPDRSVEARASVETPLERPRPGWAQNDPDRIRQATLEALTRVLDEVEAAEVEAIGITNQRETTVAWDPATGEALAPAVSWQCRRTAPLCEALREREGVEERVRARTGLVLDPYFSATKMRWLLDNEEAVARAEGEGRLALGTVDSFLVHGLTGEHATDPSNASRTLLFDLHKGDWAPELAALLDLPLEALAEVRPSSGRFGLVSGDAALGGELADLEGVPVLGVAGDQQASLFGHGCFEPGEAKGTLGTGAFFLVNTGQRALEAQQGVLTTVAWDLGEGLTYALEGAALACSSALAWATEVGLLEAPEALDRAAEPAEDSDGAVFVPALYGLGAPHWDADAKASLMGLSATTDRGHVARAIAEGLSAQNALLLRALAASGQSVEAVRLDGGVSRSRLLCQLLADGAQVPVYRSGEGEVTAMGAAGLAGLAAGLWDLEELEPGTGEPFEPEGGHASFIDRYEQAVAATRSFR